MPLGLKRTFSTAPSCPVSVCSSSLGRAWAAVILDACYRDGAEAAATTAAAAFDLCCSCCC